VPLLRKAAARLAGWPGSSGPGLAESPRRDVLAWVLGRA